MDEFTTVRDIINRNREEALLDRIKARFDQALIDQFDRHWAEQGTSFRKAEPQDVYRYWNTFARRNPELAKFLSWLKSDKALEGGDD